MVPERSIEHNQTQSSTDWRETLKALLRLCLNKAYPRKGGPCRQPSILIRVCKGWSRGIMTKGLFITGTDTDVGKTSVAVTILQQCVSLGIHCRAYKPVASGTQFGPSDIDRLWSASGNVGTHDEVCPQSFQLPVAPEQAAAAEGRQVDDDLLRQGLQPHMLAELVLIEGAGGLFSPLSHQTLNVDLARDFQIPVVLVDSSRLGAIGRTLTAVTAAESVGLTVSAVVLSQSESGNQGGDTTRGGDKTPESPDVLAQTAQAELQRRLPHLVVCGLGYNASTIQPLVEWQLIAEPLDVPFKTHP